VTVTSPHDPDVRRHNPYRGRLVRDEQAGWRESAACRFLETDQFFPIGKTGRAVAEIQEAKDICASCPVRQPCLTFALDTHQAYGIWGGYDEDERRPLLRQRQRA
jgi:WhiB family redox-sensing transcriptional regulator